MQERAARAARAIHDVFAERKDAAGVVRPLFARVIHQATPAVTDADDVVAVAQGANRGVKPRDVAAACQDTDCAFAHRPENTRIGVVQKSPSGKPLCRSPSVPTWSRRCKRPNPSTKPSFWTSTPHPCEVAALGWTPRCGRTS